jgi:hypothetical protein
MKLEIILLYEKEYCFLRIQVVWNIKDQSVGIRIHESRRECYYSNFSISLYNKL